VPFKKPLKAVFLFSILVFSMNLSRGAANSATTSLLHEADSLIEEGRLLEAYSWLQKLKIESDLLEPFERGRIINKQGTIKDMLGQNVEARSLFHQALRIGERHSDSAAVGDAYNNLGCSFFKNEHFDSASYYFARTADVFATLGDFKRLSIIELNVISMMIQEGMAEKGIEYYKSSFLNKSTELHPQTEAVTNLNIGVAYLNLDSFLLSEAYLLKAIELAIEYDYAEYEMMSLSNLGDLHYNFKRFKESCDYYEEYYTLKDSLYSSSTALSIAQLEQEYALAKEKLSLKEAELETITWQRWVIAIAALFVIVLLVIYGEYKRRKAIQKARTQAILQTREDENKRITDLLWSEIGSSTKGGKLTFPGQELPEHTIPGAIAAARFLSNQQFNPYLQLGLTNAVDNLITVLSKGKGILITRELEDIEIDKQDRLIYYRVIENILVEVFSRMNTTNVQVELQLKKSDLLFQVEVDEVLDSLQLRFQSAAARLEQLNGKLKFELLAESSTVKVVIPV